jgi:hypothetical protein
MVAETVINIYNVHPPVEALITKNQTNDLG